LSAGEIDALASDEGLRLIVLVEEKSRGFDLEIDGVAMLGIRLVNILNPRIETNRFMAARSAKRSDFIEEPLRLRFVATQEQRRPRARENIFERVAAKLEEAKISEDLQVIEIVNFDDVIVSHLVKEIRVWFPAELAERTPNEGSRRA
jgi:hypothetical protein